MVSYGNAKGYVDFRIILTVAPLDVHLISMSEDGPYYTFVNNQKSIREPSISSIVSGSTNRLEVCELDVVNIFIDELAIFVKEISGFQTNLNLKIS